MKKETKRIARLDEMLQENNPELFGESTYNCSYSTNYSTKFLDQLSERSNTSCMANGSAIIEADTTFDMSDLYVTLIIGRTSIYL